jgi:hypothetical protein
MMNGVATVTKYDADMIHFSGIRRDLNISDKARSRVKGKRGQHGVEPAGLEDEIIVEQGKNVTLGNACAAIVSSGVTEVSLIKKNDVRRGQFAQKIARAIGRSIVHQDDLVRESRRQSCFQRRQTSLRVRELVEDGDDERDLHLDQVEERVGECLMSIDYNGISFVKSHDFLVGGSCPF